MIKNILKKSVVIALSMALVAPCISSIAVDTYADSATIIKEYDFESGLRGIYDTDSAYKIVSAPGQILMKTPEQREDSDRVDANGFIIQGEGANTKYVTNAPGNQPAVKYDDVKGTVFFLAGTYDVEELVKKLPADVENDEVASELLDTTVPVGTVVREAATFKSAMTFTNPYKSLEGDSAVISFWAMVPSGSSEEKVALIEFSNNTDAVSFAYDTTISELAETGKWHHFVYVIAKDAVTGYIDGNASSIAPVVDGTTPEDMIAFLKNADIFLGATNVSSLRTVEETVIDDIAFYNGTMSSEEVNALYSSEYEEMNSGTDIEKPLAFYSLSDSEEYTDLNAENPSIIEEFNINGHVVPGLAVVENEKGAEINGIKIESPYAGLNIEGATIGYWLQVEPKAKIAEKGTSNNPDKGYTGKYPNELVINETVALTFMDTRKNVFNPKHDETAEGFSYLYTKNRMQSYFEEGGYFGMNTGNHFEAESEDAAALSYVDESRNWHYMTIVINNNGITTYCDGKKIEGLYENRGARFMDGYYRRVGERQKISTLYGAFGGSGNQLTTQITSFLTYEDTDMYFGWLPTSDYRNETTSPINISRMSCYSSDMTAEEVAALYNNEISEIEAMPEYVDTPDYTLGDMDKDGAVAAADALVVLKIAAKLEEATEESMTIGDLTADGILDASDALEILMIAAKLK